MLHLQWKIIDSLHNLFSFFLSEVNQLSYTEGTAQEKKLYKGKVTAFEDFTVAFPILKKYIFQGVITLQLARKFV